MTLNCGSVMGCVIRQHEPYCLIDGNGWKKYRCQEHAGEPVPANVGEHTEASQPSSFSSARSLVKTLPPRLMAKLDPKQKASGERE